MSKEFTKTEVFYCAKAKQLKEASYFNINCNCCDVCNHSNRVTNIDEYKKQIIKDYENKK